MSFTVKDIRDYAKSLGISAPPGLKKKDDLIHSIQTSEGNSACFKNIPDCALGNCKWHADCVGR
ncbi:MAG: SAP domain-containing protein [Nitrospinae bacterium]|nr:SAP domain-containing protein [Nitrospinota bacterium]